MGTFSIFLMTLLFGVLQTTCPFCEFSAACSVLLGMLAWLGGCLPPQKTKEGAQASGAAFLATTMAAVVLFMSSDASIAGSNTAGSNTLSFGPSLLAAAASSKETLNAPPAISTTSTEREIKLATQLQKLDAKMYGAYWCSHCYDQKQTFGKEAFAKIPYLECSKDGVNSQYKVCKDRKLEGYPTWEINGKLYPGEQELEELEDVVKEIQSRN
jgi:protein-disulfide isomerase